MWNKRCLPLSLATPAPAPAPPPGVREERLQAAAGLREPGSMTSWRGRSGRRYVAGVHPASPADLPDVAGAVVMAVQRGRDGGARLVDLASPAPDTTPRARLRWLLKARERGATELHVHRLAETDRERRAVIRDLRGGSA